VNQARVLAEAMQPYAELSYAELSPRHLGPYVESIRRFGAGEFVPQAELEQATARISVSYAGIWVTG
jgi:hypothetical protein